MEDQTLANPEGGNVAPLPGSAAAEGFSGSGPSPGATSAAAGRQRKPGRWRRIPRITQPVKVTLVPTGLSKLPLVPAIWSPVPAPPPRRSDDKRRRELLPSKSMEVVFGLEGSKEVLEAMEQGNRGMLEEAKRLEEADDDLCETEEDKITFRALKEKFIAVYRDLATTKPENVVFKDQPPSDTQ